MATQPFDNAEDTGIYGQTNTKTRQRQIQRQRQRQIEQQTQYKAESP